MFTPLDAAHQQAIIASPYGSAMIGAIEAAGIVIENNNIGGWQATDAAGAESIIDNASGWLPSAKRMKLADLQSRYDEVIAAGRIYGANTFQIDDVPPADAQGKATRGSSQQSITSAGAWAGNVINNVPGTAPWPSGFAWRDARNAMVPMTAAQCYAFSQDVAAYVAAVDANYFALAGTISAAPDAATLSGIDLTSGWPAN